jgi:hypothetical protein
VSDLKGAPKGVDVDVDVDYRDFPPFWHAKALAVSAAALIACLLLAWNLFLG